MMQSIAHAGSSSSSASAPTATSGRVPWIFLSHSGYQKEFTRRLNEELVHAGHSPFFDQDATFSLPKGIPYPQRILESCQGCKLGIIVLSHQYMESFWPMLELQQLKNAQVLLYPLFYELQPADLASAENLQRWQCKWNEWQRKSLDLQKRISSSGSKLQINTDVASWPAALEELKYRSGDVCKQDRSNYGSDDAFLKAIVSHVCSTLPPPPNYILSVDIKGGHRMEQEIDEVFNQQVTSGADDVVTVLGVYGIGGSGKSTLCLNMANYYSKDFLGRSCCLELPTVNGGDESQQLLHNIKAALPTFAQSSDNIFKLEQAMTRLQEGLYRNKVFLALDNVWDERFGVGWDTAKKIMLMNCMPGSKIMVTSRSKGVLEALFRCRNTRESEQQHILNGNIVYVPSITEDEAMQALMSHSCFSHLIPPEDLMSLARSCFFDGQCYPLYLKTIGAELRASGKASFSEQEWRKLLLDLQAQIKQGIDNEDTVADVIKKSFERLSPKLQNIFKDLVTCTPKAYGSLHQQCKWLSCLHGGFTTEQIRNQLLKLEYHGLLEVRSHRSWFRTSAGIEAVHIHDLHKLAAMKTLSPDAPSNHFLDLDDLCSRSQEELSKYKYIYGAGTYRNNISGLSNLEMLVLKRYPRKRLLSMKSMKALRFLELEEVSSQSQYKSVDGAVRCSGWEGAPNLVFLKLCEFRSLKDIGHLGSLLKLEELVVQMCDSLEVVNVGKLQKLRILDLSLNTKLLEFFFIEKSSRFRKFLNSLGSTSTVGNCEWCPPNLQELDVSGCRRLKSLPNLRNAAALTTLRADGCDSILTEVKISALALTSLQVLELSDWRPYSHDDDDDDARRSLTALELLALTLCDLHQPEDWSAVSSVDVNYGLVNLQELRLDLCVEDPVRSSDYNMKEIRFPVSSSYYVTKIIMLNVGGLASLKLLTLGCFPCLQEIACLSSLAVTLQSLYLSCCNSLEEITGLSALTNLEKLTTYGCSSLRQLGSLGALTNLEVLCVRECSSLQEIAGLGALTKLRNFEVSDLPLQTYIDLGTNTMLERVRVGDCSSLQQIMGLGALTNLGDLSVGGCSSLQQINMGLGALPNLDILSVWGCSSLQQIIGLGAFTNLSMLMVNGCPALQQIIGLSHTLRASLLFVEITDCPLCE